MAFFYLNEFINTPSFLSFLKCPSTGITQISFMLHCSNYWGSQFEEYLKVIGHQLHHLVISDYNNPFIVDLEDINSLCPSLSTLCLKHLDLTNPCHSITPNFNLTSLVLDECNVVDSTFILKLHTQIFNNSNCHTASVILNKSLMGSYSDVFLKSIDCMSLLFQTYLETAIAAGDGLNVEAMISLRDGLILTQYTFHPN
ncbi:hypothetical protein BDB01DRAFT_896432 [Pilobolus umbonatus]|nr:hypothetical protein BDB01DRAFT_896432 [Pilobolus umbonatus]